MKAVLITLLCSLTAPLQVVGTPPAQEATKTDTRTAAANNNRFALQLYSQLAGEEGNLFLCSYSIRTALAMTCAGARGRTAEEMRRVLCFGERDEALQRRLGRLAAELAAADDDADCELAFANSLWGQVGLPIRPQFLDLLRESHAASYNEVDYATASEEARRAINGWVADRTRGRIDELREEGDLDGEVILTLVNAVYFNGAWPIRFAEENTRPRPFFVPPREGEGTEMRRIDVPTMFQTKELRYLRQKGLSIVELPYAGDRLSMVILLPGDHDGLPHLEAALTPELLNERLSKLQPTETTLYLPKFSLSSRFELKETLQALGMVDAFGKGADFTGMVENDREIFIDEVIPAATVTVDEAGTEAAGATAVIMKKRGGPAIHVNHPFLFLIRDRQTGTILFLGRVTDPTQG